MKKKPNAGLIVALMMFPQIVETIYSPVLPHIADVFAVTFETAAQTMSVYFIAFAFGVVFWGRMSDVLGRRKAMLAGLVTYGVGAALAMMAPDFEVLMLARILSAFGAAVGSVVTQTMLRDSYDGPELGKVFSLMGMGISISPVIGLLSGGALASTYGHLGVFCSLLGLAMMLWLVSAVGLPETRPECTSAVNLRRVAATMVRDVRLWRSACWVALFNLMIFGYYSQAPFIFSSLGMSSVEFGYSGIALAVGSMSGSMINKKLLSKGWPADHLVLLACVLALAGSIGVWLTQSSVLFLLPMMLVVVSFGIAIPNILSQALVNYKHVAGTAGALFGLCYYLLLGVALGLSAMIQDLGIVLVAAAALSGLLCLSHKALQNGVEYDG
ncbi:multidrug effflux MFS transporter [Photobacterium sagamiensis]|uniref:multidrug effflux MFS transporter n=1 Tax=Photobacterium sagamiensis TaxID=2910241 RepID=UPI003D1078AE